MGRVLNGPALAPFGVRSTHSRDAGPQVWLLRSAIDIVMCSRTGEDSYAMLFQFPPNNAAGNDQLGEDWEVMHPPVENTDVQGQCLSAFFTAS